MTEAPPPLTVASRRFFGGCAAGLAEPTALLDVVVGADPARVDAAEARVQAAVGRLLAADALPGVSETDWPRVFLVDKPGDDAAARLASWVVAATVAVQRWGADPVWRGRVVRAEPGRLQLALPWRRQAFFDDAVALALRWVWQWVWPAGPVLEDRVRHWLGTAAPGAAALTASAYFGDRWAGIRSGGLSPATLGLLHAAADRGMPIDVLPNSVQIGWGVAAERLDRTATGHTGWIANATARNNWKTRQLMHRHAVPAANARLVSDVGHAETAANALGWPVLLGSTTADLRTPADAGIPDIDELRRAFEQFTAQKSATSVMIEHRPAGSDHRLLIVHGRVVSAIRHTPQGPTSVSSLVHPDTAALARRATRLVGLDIAEVHVLTPDIGRSWTAGGFSVRAVKSQPDLEPHRTAHPGRDLEGELLDILFDGRSARIPVTAVTGGDEAGPTAQMLQRIWGAAGVLAGVCTRAELRVGADVYSNDDLAGAAGLRAMLIDPGIGAAVLELLPERVAAAGHPCDRYEVVGAFGPVPDGQRADLLGRVGRALVVDADDPACAELLVPAPAARLILVSATPHSAAVAAHRASGGGAVFADADGRVVAADGAAETPLPARSEDRPTLWAAALAWAHGIEAGTIGRALGKRR